MGIAKTVFICQECGYKSVRWLGRCPNCGSWNSLLEEIESAEYTTASNSQTNSKPVPITQICSENITRIPTGIDALDVVLGSGLVPSSVILLGGEPGIGKSTLSLEFARGIAKKDELVLYVAGEESITQIKMRAERISADVEGLYLLSETNLDAITKTIKEISPKIVIIDSIQTVFNPQLSSSPGSVSQIRESASYLTQLAKSLGFSLWIIGHVTKDGAIAGPRILEHIVDVVLYFEGERYGNFRILRAVKNRFGATNEIAVFEMKQNGLTPVVNPSEFFISNYHPNEPGVCIGSVIEGIRPILIEVQALVTQASGFGAPFRRSQGFDPNRLALLLAVLEKKLGYRLYEYDVFVSITGGIKVKDPGIDLAVAMAIVSSLRSTALPENTVAIGEISLTGQVRSVSMMDYRIKEAKKLGFKKILAPITGSVSLQKLLEEVF